MKTPNKFVVVLIVLIPILLTLPARWHWRPGAFVLAAVLLLGGAALLFWKAARESKRPDGWRDNVPI